MSVDACCTYTFKKYRYNDPESETYLQHMSMRTVYVFDVQNTPTMTNEHENNDKNVHRIPTPNVNRFRRGKKW